MNKCILGIIILNYSSFQDTIKLVDDLQHQTVANFFQIIIVDNFSPNDSFDQLIPLELAYKNVKVLKTGSNLGYAKGNNFGLKYLDKNVHPEYVAILNNDIILQNNCFERLIEKHKQLEKAAFIAPKQLNIYGEAVSIFKINTFFDDFLNLFYLVRFYKSRKKNNYNAIENNNIMEVDLIPGSFMFTSFELFKDIGFFYPNTFLYCEERFLSIAVKKIFLKNYIICNQTYIHAHSKTIDITHDEISKNKQLHKRILEFTRYYRNNGVYKALLLNFIMKYSILELKFILILKNMNKHFCSK